MILFSLEADPTDRKDAEKLTAPDFSKYLYFLFAPTLIYCDKYPRNAVIHWDFVIKMFGQVLAAVVYVYYVVVRFCVPTFENLNQNQITLSIFMTVLFNSIMPGSLFLLLGREQSEKNAAVVKANSCRILWVSTLLVECICRNASIR